MGLLVAETALAVCPPGPPDFGQAACRRAGSPIPAIERTWRHAFRGADAAWGQNHYPWVLVTRSSQMGHSAIGIAACAVPYWLSDPCPQSDARLLIGMDFPGVAPTALRCGRRGRYRAEPPEGPRVHPLTARFRVHGGDPPLCRQAGTRRVDTHRQAHRPAQLLSTYRRA